MMKPKFVHLHSHTEYSLLDGMAKIKKLVKQTKALGMDSLAITDHGSMYGAIEFYKACIAEGVRPIIGCELYVAPRSHKHKEGKVDTEPFHLTVLAKNYQGYLNLIQLVSIAHLEGFYYKPRVDRELLKQFHEGLICLSACPAGEFIRTIENQDLKKAEEVAASYRDIFGDGNYFFELQNHHYDELLTSRQYDPEIRKELEHMGKLQKLTWQAVGELSPKLGIPIVATNDFHYINEDDAEAQDAMVCVSTGKFIKDINRLRMIDTPNLFLKSPEQMLSSFNDIPEALDTSVKIAEAVDLEIPLGNPKFPIFDIPQGKNADDYLRELTFERAKGRMNVTPEREERLNYELEVIKKKKYPTYFLIVSDFMNWAKDRGILTNTRGSAAGSLVLYALGVTDIDPIFFKLPFERFLNPFRPSLPDIDADMSDDRRDDVIRYCMEKYGHDKVAHIVTFGTMMGRAAIRDVGRVLAMPYADVDRIAKLVPPPQQGFHKPLADAIKEVPELIQMYRENPEVRKLLDLAVRIEGTVRHASVHAAGIVISPEEMTKFAPLQKEANGDKVVVQYDFHCCEDVGLVKMDFLGIRNLSILGRAVEYVKRNQGIEVDLKKLPLDDAKAFELLARGDTMGIFQLEGDGMTKYLMELRPTSIFDISAMVALYRPGPLAIIPEYIARKHNPSKVDFFDERMKEDLERSLGLLVYQDDVLLTAIKLAGYDWEEVDVFRKAMGKKIPEEMAKQHDKFIKGCVDNGIPKVRAEEIFKLMEPFAKYGFNKAHAASYAMVAYQTAYMKANFPVEFMAAVMTAEYGDTDKIAHAMEECKRMGIVVLHPDINFSDVGFSIEELKTETGEVKQGIRFGLSAIKNVGISAIESIIKARKEKPFKDLGDICSRSDSRIVNKKTLESLIKAGALDFFGKRSAMLSILDQCLEQSHKQARMTSSGQTSLFGGTQDEVFSINVALPDIDEMPLEQLLIFEKELLGFYLHEPVYMDGIRKINDFVSLRIENISDEYVGRKMTLGGVIQEVKKVITKKSGSEMAFIKLFDGTGTVPCVVFPKLYAEIKYDLMEEKVVIVEGKIEKREDEFSVIVDEIKDFDPQTSIRTKFNSIEVELPTGSDGELMKRVNATLRQFPGTTPISLLIPSGDTFKKMRLNFLGDPNSEMVRQMEGLLGHGKVRFGD